MECLAVASDELLKPGCLMDDRVVRMSAVSAVDVNLRIPDRIFETITSIIFSAVFLDGLHQGSRHHSVQWKICLISIFLDFLVLDLHSENRLNPCET